MASTRRLRPSEPVSGYGPGCAIRNGRARRWRGFLIAMAALGVAMAAHWMRRPTLLGRGSVPAEEVVLAVVAAAWGWRVAGRRRRAWFMPAEPAHRDGPDAPPGGPGQ
jgi:hypothetical protein